MPNKWGKEGLVLAFIKKSKFIQGALELTAEKKIIAQRKHIVIQKASGLWELGIIGKSWDLPNMASPG